MIRIKPQIPGVLGDEKLQRTMRSTFLRTVESRDAAVAEVDNWEALREHARRVKAHTLSRLHDYLLELEKNLQGRGARVVWAESAEEALRYVSELARRKGVRKIVKSKTMLGEEIHLNELLDQQGFEVVETDLGEYIVQLCGEAPFHIVTPALHKTKEEVADLFVEKLGMERTSDVEELTMTARRVLRQEFLQADMGISGVNFGIAETGTIVVVENEGNARLSTSVPKIHVALMGIEKVIPRASDLPVFLKLLTRSATGQKITSYVNFISGPRGEEERDGPEEFHLILVDNGRSKLLGDDFMRQTLACIRCGFCLNICPVFQTIGGHAYQSVYQGPIGAILTPQLLSLEEAPEHAYASSLCGACAEVCPVKIEIPKILLKLRERAKEDSPRDGGQDFMERFAMKIWAWAASSAGRFGFFGALSRRLLRLLQKDGRVRIALPPLSTWQKERDLPAIPKQSFRQLLRKGKI